MRLPLKCGKVFLPHVWVSQISPVHKNARSMSEYFNKTHTTWMTYGYIPSEHVHYRDLKVCQPALSVRCVRTAVQRQHRWADLSRPCWKIRAVQATELRNTLAGQRASTHKSKIHLCGETVTIIPLLLYPDAVATRPSMHRPRRRPSRRRPFE